jgi:hypothetical protein
LAAGVFAGAGFVFVGILIANGRQLYGKFVAKAPAS